MPKAKDLSEIIESIATLEKRKEELEEEYKRKMKKISDEASGTKVRLESARTHAVMSSTPYIAKALNLSSMLNITIDDIRNSPELIEKLKSRKSFNDIFAEYCTAMKAVGDYLYNHKDIQQDICSYIARELNYHESKPE